VLFRSASIPFVIPTSWEKLRERDRLETKDNSNIPIESPLSIDIWIDQSYVRDDFGVFHEMIDFDSPHSRLSGLQTSDFNKTDDPPNESPMFRKPSR